VASDVKITFRVRHRWLLLALFFERLARFCDKRALIATDEHGKNVRCGPMKYPAAGGLSHNANMLSAYEEMEAVSARMRGEKPRNFGVVVCSRCGCGPCICVDGVQEGMWP
jgi:hypothetical protein